MHAYMKIIVAVIWIAVALFGLLTIWNKNNSNTTPSTFTAPEVTTPIVIKAPNKVYEYKDLIVGFIQISSESDWRAANNASFRETAIALGIKLKFADDRADAWEKQQVDAFQQFIEDPEINVIVLAPVRFTGWEKQLQQAKDASKIVIIIDRHIEASEDLYFTFVSNDFVEEGRKAGIEMCKLLEGSKKKNVWELVGIVGSWAEMERGIGFRETAGECGIVIANSQTGNFSRTEGKQVTEAWLKNSKDVQGIFAQNDDMGLGAIEALKETDLIPASDVKIVSIDATASAFQAMLNGDLNVSVECSPLFAPQVYEAALAALNGEARLKRIPLIEGVYYMDDPKLKEIAASRKY